MKFCNIKVSKYRDTVKRRIDAVALIRAIKYNIDNITGKLDTILEALKELRTDVQSQGKRLETLEVGVQLLEAGQKSLEAGQQALELKIEAVHAYQKQAHTEIMDSLFESNEMTGKAIQVHEKEIVQIKKHVGMESPDKN